MLDIGYMLNDRYEILEQVGSGGMSIVYKGKDTKLGRFVAIKVLREEFCLDDSFVGKFKVEAQSAASLSHNNIVNIYDVGNEGRTHYIVMEYLEGETLKEYIRNRGRLPEPEILKVALAIANALEHAHNNHIIHRDIKPQNIMLTNDGKVKVTDFGIARIASDKTIDCPENASGSVYYIAPEQARGGYQDNKSDIYSLGITMYEMSTGTVPFTGDNAVNVALKQIHDEMPMPTEFNDNLSANIETIIVKATQKKTTQRYQTAKELVEDLKSCMANPDDLLVYTVDVAPEETIIMNHEEMKHIWSKNEVLEYSGNRDPLDKVVTGLGVALALILVSLIGYFIYGSFAKEFIPVNVTVPNLVEASYEEALSTLEELSLSIDVVESRFDNELEEGKIISQMPEAETVVSQNSKVEVVVSKGKELKSVVSVNGRNYEEAIRILEENGFLYEIIPENSNLVSEGNVIRQDPLPNQKVTLDMPVKVYVSSGPEVPMVEMPDIRDLTLLEAGNVLGSLKLDIGNVTYVNHSTVEEGKIVSMTVEAGKEVREGYVVDVAVSLGPEIVPVTSSFIINNILDYNQRECVMKVILQIGEEETVIFEETVNDSDFPMTLSATAMGTGTIIVYNNDNLQFQFYHQFTVDGGI